MLTINNTIDLPFNYFRQLATTRVTQPLKMLKKSKRILLIEDDVDLAVLLAQSLKKKYNCVVYVAQDPFEAMNMMTEKFYDLIILDWQLPGLNGAETLVHAEKGLQLDPATPAQWDRMKAPVVVLSSAQKNACSLKKTKHFSYAGYVTKMQPMNNIVENLGTFIEQQPEIAFQSA